MPRVAVSYGPPGQKGVTQIMGIGADEFEPDPTRTMLGRVGWASIGVWAAGVLFNRPLLRGIGLGGAAASFGVKHLAEKDLEKPAPQKPAAPAPAPTAGVRGWGPRRW